MEPLSLLLTTTSLLYFVHQNGIFSALTHWAFPKGPLSTPGNTYL